MTGSPLCSLCGQPDPMPVLRMSRLPVLCNETYPTGDAARRAPTASMDLRLCGRCGHLFNAAFYGQRVKYGAHYENSLHGSGRFRQYADTLAAALRARYGLRGKRIVEIGCGQGDFLRLLCEGHGNEGMGFDPSFTGPDGGGPVAGVTITRRHFGAASGAGLAPDLVCCRHLLEHLEDPVGFLCEVRRACTRRGGTPVFFEVPNAWWTLHDGGIWDLIYEHCGYFTSNSLRFAFAAAGFVVNELRPAFGGQFLTLHATAPGPAYAPARRAGAGAHDGMASLADLTANARAFAAHFESAVSAWNRQLQRLRTAGSPAAIWGAGSKGVTFANVVPSAAADVGWLVDINPRKQGGHVPGTGHPIVPPQALREHRPSAVIAMNPIYVAEIRHTLGEMGVTAPLLTVGAVPPALP
jgi:SAM-dependent methyltransferase